MDQAPDGLQCQLAPQIAAWVSENPNTIIYFHPEQLTTADESLSRVDYTRVVELINPANLREHGASYYSQPVTTRDVFLDHDNLTRAHLCLFYLDGFLRPRLTVDTTSNKMYYETMAKNVDYFMTQLPGAARVSPNYLAPVRATPSVFYNSVNILTGLVFRAEVITRLTIGPMGGAIIAEGVGITASCFDRIQSWFTKQVYEPIEWTWR